MRADDYSIIYRTRLGIAMLALTVILGLLFFSYHRFTEWHNRPGEARRIADAATVEGYSRTAVVNVPDGDNQPFATAFFIGPAQKPDPLTAVSVPTIRLEAVPPPPTSTAWDYQGYPVAKGKRADGCRATVAFDSDPRPSTPDDKGTQKITILTPEQLDEVHRGTRLFIEISIGGCGR